MPQCLQKIVSFNPRISSIVLINNLAHFQFLFMIFIFPHYSQFFLFFDCAPAKLISSFPWFLLLYDFWFYSFFSPQYLHLAGQGGGVIQGTSSEAILVTLLAARDKVLRRIGKNSLGKLVVYASDQTHSSLQKACQVISD